PPTAMCAGSAFTYDLSATDIDGDSLYYSFRNPFNGGSNVAPAPNPPSSGPFTDIPWGGGYSTANQIDANPQFTIDPQTGFLSGTPTNIGTYIVSFGVKEYRNGIFINEVYRDFLIYVSNCPSVTAEFSDQINQAGQSLFCTGTSVNFTNGSLNSTNYFWNFGDTTTTLDTSNLLSPTYNYPDTGIYTVMLVANPGLTCADTAFHDFEVYPTLAPSFAPVIDQCLLNNSFTFNALGNNNTNDTILWDFSPSASPPTVSGATGTTTFLSSGTYQIELTMKNFGCTSTYVDSIIIFDNPIASFPPQTIFCNGLGVPFGNNSTNSTAYFWNFGDQSINSDTSILTTPTYTYADSGTYNVTLIASQQGLCYDTISQTFSVHSIINPSFLPVTNQCLLNNSFIFNALGNNNSTDTVLWDFGSSASPPNSIGGTGSTSFPSTGTYTIELTIKNFGCTESYTDIVTIFDNPISNFSPQSIFCNGLTINFTNNSINSSTYLWNFGDQTINSDTSILTTPTYIYADSGTYNVTLITNQQNL
ncbi:MAG: PKD domain-containing protein, partial [Flavobacteriales bacterium]|nr:PKD domain-containing protein [Flavobacteriales bacterium]